MNTIVVMLLAQSSMRVHEFSFNSPTPATSVFVAGSFNNWNKNADAMSLRDGVWKLRKELAYGKHQYKFVVNGETWLVDPASKSVDDGNGNKNSELVIYPPDFTSPASVSDGKIAKSVVVHHTELPMLNYDQNAAIVRIETRPQDVQSVAVWSGGRAYPGTPVGGNEISTAFEARIPWDRKQDLRYVFELSEKSTSWKYGSDGLSKNPKPFVVSAKSFVPFQIPSWVPETVFYQIFPDRFANGLASNDPEMVMAWNAKPTYFNRYGGDVAGIKSKIPYLKKLGVSGVYFTPIFKSPSNHRYDATDYMTSDPEFGSNQEFRELVLGLHQNNIRTVLDFAFNHTATNYHAFSDLIQNGERSKFKDWYFPKSFPIRVTQNPNYEAWWGFESMPKLNVKNPEVSATLLASVGYWFNFAEIDGMRLDVANEVDSSFWKKMRPFLKESHPNSWILGEIWGDGNPWLKGDQFDSVMNYQFRSACLNFFAKGKIDSRQFLSELFRIHRSYPVQVSRNMLNLLSSHDTPRFITECLGDKQLHKMAAGVQFTWVGCPSIYYGEEIGMEGGSDPDNRRGMDWNLADANPNMLSYYKKLIAFRQTSNAIQWGTVADLGANAHEGAFGRFYGSERVLTVFNRSEQAKSVFLQSPNRVSLKGEYIDIISEKRKSLSDRPSVMVPPKSVVMLASKGAKSSFNWNKPLRKTNSPFFRSKTSK